MITLIELCQMHETSIVRLTEASSFETLRLGVAAHVACSAGAIGRNLAIDIACLDPAGPSKLERL